MAGGTIFKSGDFPPLVAPIKPTNQRNNTSTPKSMVQSSTESEKLDGAKEATTETNIGLDLPTFGTYSIAALLPAPQIEKSNPPKTLIEKKYREDYKQNSNEGLPAVFFESETKERLVAKVNYVVIAKFSHGRPPFKEFQSFLASFKFVGKYVISAFDHKHVFIEFIDFKEFVTLWTIQSCLVKGFRVRFFHWVENFNPKIESSVAPVWIGLPRLPLYLMEEEALITIASSLGKPLRIDPLNLSHQKVGAAFVCVAVDMSKPLPQGISINFKEKGKVIETFHQQVIFHTPPMFCKACHHLGHSSIGCKNDPENDGKSVGKEKHGKGAAQTIESAMTEMQVVKNLEKGKNVAIQQGRVSIEVGDCSDNGMYADATANRTTGQKREAGKPAIRQNTDSVALISPNKGNNTGSVKEAGSEHLPNASNAENPVGEPATQNHGTYKKSGNAELDATANAMEGKQQEEVSKKDPIEVLHQFVMDSINGNNMDDGLAEDLLEQGLVQECSSEEEGPHVDYSGGAAGSTAVTTPTMKGLSPVSVSAKQAAKPKTTEQSHSDPTSSAGNESPEKPGRTAAAASTAQPKVHNADDGSAHVNSCPPLLMEQNMEKFNRDSKAYSETKKTRILCKNIGLENLQRRCFSDEEDAPNLKDDLNYDPIVVAEGLQLRWSKMMESKAFIMHQRSVSPVGRTSRTLKSLQYKIDLIEYPKESSMIYMNNEYEEEQRLKDTRKIQQVDEAEITPKKRGKTAKQQPKPTQAPSKSSLLMDQAPRKRGRPKKK